MRRWIARLILGVLALAIGAEVFLVVSGRRFLIGERLSQPGTHLIVQGYGDLGEMTEPKLVCTYFTGRRRLVSVYHYSPANFIGRDACPTWINGNE